MKISTKGRYGLRILVDLATHNDGKPRLIRDIAESQAISEKYISRLVIDLRRAKMIRSIRGVKGGFHLAMAPKDITLLDVLEAMEGPLSIVGCVSSPKKCNRTEACAAHEIWSSLNEKIREIMRGVTLEDVLDAYERQKAADGYFDYII